MTDEQIVGAVCALFVVCMLAVAYALYRRYRMWVETYFKPAMARLDGTSSGGPQ